MEMTGKRVMNDVPGGKIGILIGFGVNYELVNGCPGHYTTAIVMYPDGSVDTYPVRDMVFVRDY